MKSLILLNSSDSKVGGIILMIALWTSLPSMAEPYHFPRVREYLDNQYLGYRPLRFHRSALPPYWYRAPNPRHHLFPRFGRALSTPPRRSARTIAQPPPALVINTIKLSEPKTQPKKQRARIKPSKAPSPRSDPPKRTRPRSSKPATPPPAPPDNLAWRYLAAGTSQTALRHFAEESGRNPDEGLPRIGLGISSALRGEIKRATQSVRRAFRDDPQGAANIPFVHGLRKRLERLAEYFRDEADESTDSQFMLAVIGHYLNDEEQSRAALDRALSLGDDSLAAKHLKKILDGELSYIPEEASTSTSEETL